jgi:DNA invertase Pin-like site-specific DNA recombinase
VKRVGKTATERYVFCQEQEHKRNINAMGNLVAYYRVSTIQQGRSGLGLEAQQEAVGRFVASSTGRLVAEYTEVESGRVKDRPQLLAAIATCRKHRAKLVIAKLDRLARNAAFLFTLRDSGVEFIAADNPAADKLTVSILAVFAEFERDMVSKRTREALAAAKARGVKLGSPTLHLHREAGSAANRASAISFAQNIRPLIDQLRGQGFTSLRSLAAELNRRAVATARGGAWGQQSVANVLKHSGGPTPVA